MTLYCLGDPIDGKNVKIIPATIDMLLTPVALAFWISGDGHYCLREGVVYISTESFTPRRWIY